MNVRSSSTIEKFIAAINRLDAAGAGEQLADGAELKFPGGITFTDVAAFLEWSKGRYRNPHFIYDSFEEIADDGKAIVYARGSFEGELNSGEKFSDIRVLDRFEIVDGKIIRKEAWSDLADYLRKKNI